MTSTFTMGVTVGVVGGVLLAAFGLAARYEEHLCDMPGEFGRWLRRLPRRCRSALAAISRPLRRKKGAHVAGAEVAR